MPLKSKAQARYLFAVKPELAEEFESKTPKGKLPEKINKGTSQIAALKRKMKK